MSRQIGRDKSEDVRSKPTSGTKAIGVTDKGPFRRERRLTSLPSTVVPVHVRTCVRVRGKPKYSEQCKTPDIRKSYDVRKYNKLVGEYSQYVPFV